MQNPNGKRNAATQVPLLLARWLLLLAGSLLLVPAFSRWQDAGWALADMHFLFTLFALTLIAQGLFLRTQWLPKDWEPSTTHLFLWAVAVLAAVFVVVVLWWTFA